MEGSGRLRRVLGFEPVPNVRDDDPDDRRLEHRPGLSVDLVRSVRPRTYPRGMLLGIVVFGAAFLVGLGLGTYTRRPLTTAFLVVGSFSALLLLSATGEVFGAAATLVIVLLVGLVAESVRETFTLLVRS
jgi:hypothetical protein